MARRCKPHAHGHDGGFRGGAVVAQIHQRRAEVVELALAHASDVGELRQHAGGFVRHDVRGIAQIDHGAGELGEIVCLDAQLSGDGHDLGDIISRGRYFRGHLLDLVGQGSVLFFRRIHGLAHRGKCALVGDRCLDRRRAQRKDGRGHDGGQCAARCRQRLGDRFALLAERFQFLTRRCPCGFRGGELLVGLLNFRSRGSHSGFGAVQSGLGIDDRVVGLSDLLRIVGLLGGDELILCALQRRFILCQALALQIELLGKHRLLGCKPRNAGIQLLDPHSSQLEAALSQRDLLAEGGDSRAAVLNGLARRVPIRLRQPQRLIAPVDLRLSGFDGGAGFIEIHAGGAHRVGGVLRALLQRRILPGELFDLPHRSAVLGLERVQICPGGYGRRVVLAQRGGKVAYLLRGGSHLFLERFLRALGFGQALGVIRLAGEALLQLAVGSGERALVLRDGVLLQGKPPLQRGELRAQAGGSLLKALHARGGQLELALRLRDLLVHRADVPREVVRLQRQRHHKVAQRFAHVLSPAFAFSLCLIFFT